MSWARTLKYLQILLSFPSLKKSPIGMFVVIHWSMHRRNKQLAAICSTSWFTEKQIRNDKTFIVHWLVGQLPILSADCEVQAHDCMCVCKCTHYTKLTGKPRGRLGFGTQVCASNLTESSAIALLLREWTCFGLKAGQYLQLGNYFLLENMD